jgi:glucose-6-phosphate isomerase, archaeal
MSAHRVPETERNPAVSTPPPRTPTLPFAAALDAATGSVSPAALLVERRVSDLAGLYADDAAWQAAVAAGDPLVYRVCIAPVPEVAGEVPFSITTIEAGAIGGECFMTKGHTHTAHEGEVYIGLAGRGLLLLFDGAQARQLELVPGVATYIPPGWAHRTANVGDDPFRFLSVYPGDAGHDYEWVLRHGMGARVYRDGSGQQVVSTIQS